MSGMFDKTTFEIECPNGHPIVKAIGELRRSPTFDCEVCSATIKVDASQFDSTMRDVDRALSDLGKTIDKFGR